MIDELKLLLEAVDGISGDVQQVVILYFALSLTKFILGCSLAAYAIKNIIIIVREAVIADHSE